MPRFVLESDRNGIRSLFLENNFRFGSDDAIEEVVEKSLLGAFGFQLVLGIEPENFSSMMDQREKWGYDSPSELIIYFFSNCNTVRRVQGADRERTGSEQHASAFGDTSQNNFQEESLS